jgi:hypothetical protein
MTDYIHGRPITDKRGRVVHLSKLGFKPLCKPHTRITYHAALIGANGSKLCASCAEKDLQAAYDAKQLDGVSVEVREAA